MLPNPTNQTQSKNESKFNQKSTKCGMQLHKVNASKCKHQQKHESTRDTTIGKINRNTTPKSNMRNHDDAHFLKKNM